VATEDSWAEQIRALEESHLRPEVRRSPEAMGRLLAEDFVEFGKSGTIHADRARIIESLRDAPSVRMSLSGFRARLLAPGVVLTTYRVENLDEARPDRAHSLRSSVWKRMDGRWQLLFHQGTPTTAPDE
jgi:hypothetical protein